MFTCLICTIIQLFGVVFVVSIVAACLLVRLLTKSPYPTLTRTRKEQQYWNPVAKCLDDFPSIDDEQSVHLSVVVPAYEEEARIPPMLEECTEFLETRSKSDPYFLYEIIIVSDGSKDKTVNEAMKFSKKLGPDKIRVLELETNRGKGGAVTLGVQSARGSVILFADADGATKFPDLAKLEQALEELLKADYRIDPETVAKREAIICGSRAHLEKDAIATRSAFRNFLMHGFHFLVSHIAVSSLKDTQCGFKLFTRQAARRCFQSLHVTRWAFDVELLYIAERLRVPLVEVSVRWTEIDGSKLIPVWSWLQMGTDLILIWLRYLVGAWKLVAC